MDNFVTILNFFRDCLTYLFDLDIPLSDTLTIKWGSIVLGLMAFPIFVKVIARLFGDAINFSEPKQTSSKGGKSK